MSAVPAPPPDAVGFSAFRALASGDGRQYSTVVPVSREWQSLEWFVRMGAAIGAILPPEDKDYFAVLDVVNEDGDIIADYGISRHGWRWVYRKLGLRWVRSDG